MNGIYLAALAVVILGVLILWWARACRRGTFRRNHVLGYRTSLTLSNDDAWIAVHRAIAPFVFVAGIGAVLAALVAALLAVFQVAAVPQVLLGMSVIWILLWVLLGIIPGHLAARGVRKGDSRADATQP